MEQERRERNIRTMNERVAGATIDRLELAKEGVVVHLKDGGSIVAQVKSGPGGDSNWYEWLSVGVPGAGDVEFG